MIERMLAWVHYNRDGKTHQLNCKDQKVDTDDNQVYEGEQFVVEDPEAIRMADELYEYVITLRKVQLGPKAVVKAIEIAPVAEAGEEKVEGP